MSTSAPPTPVESFAAFIRSLSAAVETPGLLGWLLGPLLRLIIRRRLKQFEQSLAELAALAEAVAAGTYRPRPERQEPHTSEITANPEPPGSDPRVRQPGRLPALAPERAERDREHVPGQFGQPEAGSRPAAAPLPTPAKTPLAPKRRARPTRRPKHRAHPPPGGREPRVAAGYHRDRFVPKTSKTPQTPWYVHFVPLRQ